MATIEKLTPQPSGQFRDISIKIANANEAVIFQVGGWDYFALQVTDDGVVDRDSAAHVLKVEKSNDGATPVPFSTPVTQSVAGMTAKQEVTCVGYVHVTNSTPGTSGTIRLHARVHRS